MKIATISKADSAGGGASTVAEHLADGLLARRHPGVHYCLYAEGGFSHHRRPIGGHLVWQLMEAGHYMKEINGFADALPLEAPFFEAEQARFGFDLFHVHDISSAVSPLTLARLARSVPVFWTMHDCSPFTGGCLYPMDCTQYRDGSACTPCPQHGQWPLDTAADTAWLGLENRRLLHRARNLHLISPSHWLAGLAAASGIVQGKVKVIPNGIPAAPFEGIDRAAARARLGLADAALVFAVSAGHLEDRRKNIADALAAIRAVTRADVAVIVLGQQGDALRGQLQGLRVIAPGFVRDRRDLATHLAAADAFVFTSRAENHPLSVLEAMAAGVAVLGYDTGVIEQVDPGVTGLLVPTGDRAALMQLFATLPSRADLGRLGAAGRARFLAEFTLERMLDRMLAHYEAQMLDRAA